MSESRYSALVCPLTKQVLTPLVGQRAKAVYQALSQGELSYMDGEKITEEAKRIGFWISNNGQQLYSVIDGVPVLLESKQVDYWVALKMKPHT